MTNQDPQIKLALEMSNEILDVINTRAKGMDDTSEVGQAFMIALSVAAGSFLQQITKTGHLQEVLDDFQHNVAEVARKASAKAEIDEGPGGEQSLQ